MTDDAESDASFRPLPATGESDDDDAAPTSESDDDAAPTRRMTRAMTSRNDPVPVRPTKKSAAQKKSKKGAAPKKSAPKKKTNKNAAPKTSTYVITCTSLQDAGLYERVGADHPLLTDFEHYMEHSSGCKSPKYRRGVVNHVRRLHHFLQKTPENPDPTVLDPEAMTDPIKFNNFIEEFGRHTSGCGQKFLEKN